MGEPYVEWHARFVADMKAIGVLRTDQCLGCGKFDCDACPCGTGTAVDSTKLSPDAAQAYRDLQRSQREGREHG